MCGTTYRQGEMITQNQQTICCKSDLVVFIVIQFCMKLFAIQTYTYCARIYVSQTYFHSDYVTIQRCIHIEVTCLESQTESMENIKYLQYTLCNQDILMYQGLINQL